MSYKRSVKTKKGYVIYKVVNGDRQFYEGVHVVNGAPEQWWSRPWVECSKLYKRLSNAQKVAAKLGALIHEVNYSTDEFGEDIIDPGDWYED